MGLLSAKYLSAERTCSPLTTKFKWKRNMSQKNFSQTIYYHTLACYVRGLDRTAKYYVEVYFQKENVFSQRTEFSDSSNMKNFNFVRPGNGAI